jgi:hypothetical protein
MAPGSCQGIVNSIATTEILPWLQHAAVVIGGKNGAGALHTRIRPVSVRCIGDTRGKPAQRNQVCCMGNK